MIIPGDGLNGLNLDYVTLPLEKSFCVQKMLVPERLKLKNFRLMLRHMMCQTMNQSPEESNLE